YLSAARAPRARCRRGLRLRESPPRASARTRSRPGPRRARTGRVPAARSASGAPAWRSTPCRYRPARRRTRARPRCRRGASLRPSIQNARAAASGSARPGDRRCFDRLRDPLEMELLEVRTHLAGRLEGLPRREDRVGFGCGAQARRAMDGRAPDAGLALVHLALMNADAHLRRVTMQPALRLQPALDVDRAIDRIAGRVEDDEEPVTRVVDLAAVMLFEDPAHLAVHPRAEVVPGVVPDRLDKVRRPRQVSEHQRLMRGRGPLLPEHRGSQLVAGPHLELVVDVAEVVFDRLRAQVETRGRLARRRAFGQRHRNLQLLRRQLLPVRVLADAGRLTARLELGQGALRPGGRAELVEGLQRRAQMLARIDPLARASKSLSEVELRAGALERVGRRFVMSQRRLEMRRERPVVGDEPHSALRTREREWLPLRPRGRVITLGDAG